MDWASSRELLIPGNIVQLKEAYQIDYCMMQLPLQRLGIDKPWLWEGFTHGIIAEVISQGGRGVERVSLYLYCPQLKLIYLNPHDGLPMHVDFSIDELLLAQIARQPNRAVG